MDTKNNIIINFLKGQGLGNQLWVFFSGIYISKTLNCNIKFGNGNFFKGRFLIESDLIEPEFIQVKKKIIIKEQFETFTSLETINYEYTIKDIEHSILASDIELIGSLQNTNFIPSKEDIFKNLKLKINCESNECIIHIRGGDYKNTLGKVSKKYLISSIYKFKDEVNNFRIITDDKKYANKLLPNIDVIIPSKDSFDHLTNAHHHSIGIREDFINIAKSKYCILSASTFSFWACYIGSLFFKKKVIAPAFWFANRVSSSWSSPANYYIEDWSYLDSKGNTVKPRNGIYPKFNSNKQQNKYLNFLIRKTLNFYLDTK